MPLFFFSTTSTMQLSKAQPIAIDIWQKFKPFCSKIKIAGSVRRQEPTVNDIEIVAVPLASEQRDMFGGLLSADRDGRFVQVFQQLCHKHVRGDIKTGRLVCFELEQGIKVDLFMPEEKDFYRQLAIRTGPSGYSAKVLAGTWSKNGWCGTTNAGLRRQSDCTYSLDKNGKKKWKCVRFDGKLPPEWKGEKEFYQWLGVDWIPPAARKVNNFATI